MRGVSGTSWGWQLDAVTQQPWWGVGGGIWVLRRAPVPPDAATAWHPRGPGRPRKQARPPGPCPTRPELAAMASYHLFTNSWKSWVKMPLGSLGGGCGAGQKGGGESSRMLLESGRKGASQPVPLRTARHLLGTLRMHPSWRQRVPTTPLPAASPGSPANWVGLFPEFPSKALLVWGPRLVQE